MCQVTLGWFYGMSLALIMGALRLSSGGRSMRPHTRTFAVFAFLFSVALVALGQDQSVVPGPDTNSAILGLPLIVWSEMQKPEPVPQPLPARPLPLPDPQGEHPTASQPPAQTANAQPQPQQPSDVRTIVGTIVKDADKYVLKTADNITYQLNDQKKAKQYEGKKVKITGTLELNSDTIQIESIELVS
jgi:hypothetical protein